MSCGGGGTDSEVCITIRRRPTKGATSLKCFSAGGPLEKIHEKGDKIEYGRSRQVKPKEESVKA